MSQTVSKTVQKAVRATRNEVPHIRRAKINLARKEAKKQQIEAQEARQNREEYGRRIEGMMKVLREEAKQIYKEDWYLGPLAPRRDVGERAATYGSVDANAYRLPERQAEDYKQWFPIAEGDRVVVIKGHEKGKIGVIDEVDAVREAVVIRDMNRHYVALPPAMRKERGVDVTAYPRAIPIADVRLVYPLKNPETGKMVDTVIDKLFHVPTVETPFQGNKASKIAKDIWQMEQERGLRVIQGTDISIPWVPSVAPPPEFNEGTDTTTQVRSQVTFQPSLIHGPMPLTVIDELRNKYGKFRRRPPGEAQARLAELEAKKERREARATALMTTPRQALANLKAKKGEEAKATRELNEKQLAKIGELVIQARQRAAEARTS
jgi:large subunit ribosomal protein L24